MYLAVFDLGQNRQDSIDRRPPREIIHRQSQLQSPPVSDTSLRSRIGSIVVNTPLSKEPNESPPLFLPVPADSDHIQSQAVEPPVATELPSSVANITILDGGSDIHFVRDVSGKIPARCPDCHNLIGDNDGSLKYHKEYRCAQNPDAEENNIKRRKQMRMYLERRNPDAKTKSRVARNWDAYYDKLTTKEQEEFDREVSAPSDDGKRRRPSMSGDASFDAQGTWKKPRLLVDLGWSDAKDEASQSNDEPACEPEKISRKSRNPLVDGFGSDRPETAQAGGLSAEVPEQHHIQAAENIPPQYYDVPSTLITSVIDQTAHDWIRLETLNDLILDDLPDRLIVLLETIGHTTLLSKLEFLIEGAVSEPDRSKLSLTIIRHLAKDDSFHAIWKMIADELMKDQDTLRWRALIPKLKTVLAVN